MAILKKTTYLIFLFFLFITKSGAQNIEKYYDYRWKECEPNAARFYSKIAKTDSGYLRKDYYIRERRLQMNGMYLDSLCKIRNGHFTLYHANGVLESCGKLIQNKREGLWLSYYNNGIMKDSTVYSNGKMVGKSLSWYSNGYQSDSISLNEDRSGVQFSWFDNGAPAAAGRYSAGMKQHGKWKYFHKNGNISSIEIYNESKLVSRQNFNEKGELLADTTNTNRYAQFKGGIEAWLKYISDRIYFPDGYKIVNADVAKVVVNFTVNENGDIENVFTCTPFDKRFDIIAENVIRKSPKWIPAMQHNRCVKQVMAQPVNFQNHRDN
jgi:hypothetical protein